MSLILYFAEVYDLAHATPFEKPMARAGDFCPPSLDLTPFDDTQREHLDTFFSWYFTKLDERMELLMSTPVRGTIKTLKTRSINYSCLRIILDELSGRIPPERETIAKLHKIQKQLLCDQITKLRKLLLTHAL